MNVDILSCKEKEKLLKHIYSKYKKAKLQLELMDIYFNPYPESKNLIEERVSTYGSNYLLKRIGKKRDYELLIEMIDMIHKRVNEDSLLILEKQFLNFQERGWWQNYYSRSTYYRLKRNAVEEFFTYYDDSLLSKRL